MVLLEQGETLLARAITGSDYTPRASWVGLSNQIGQLGHHSSPIKKLLLHNSSSHLQISSLSESWEVEIQCRYMLNYQMMCRQLLILQ